MKIKLLKIQSELKAPKNQKNQHGGYMYRSCEDILESVKPLCVKHNCTLTITDDIIAVNDRVYVKATARIEDNEKGSDCVVQVSAFAREQQAKYNKDGKEIMDHAQLTGSASSYARKYALNGLFCIDDTKDADAQKPEETKKEKGDFKKAIESIEKSKDKNYLNSIKKLIEQRTWTESEKEELEKAIEQKESIL